jgi:hypothetical protein
MADTPHRRARGSLGRATLALLYHRSGRLSRGFEATLRRLWAGLAGRSGLFWKYFAKDFAVGKKLKNVGKIFRASTNVRFHSTSSPYPYHSLPLPSVPAFFPLALSGRLLAVAYLRVMWYNGVAPPCAQANPMQHHMKGKVL